MILRLTRASSAGAQRCRLAAAGESTEARGWQSKCHLCRWDFRNLGKGGRKTPLGDGAVMPLRAPWALPGLGQPRGFTQFPEPPNQCPDTLVRSQGWLPPPDRGAFPSPGPRGVRGGAERSSAVPTHGTDGPQGLIFFCGKNWPGCERGSGGDCLYLGYKQMPSGTRELFI